MDKERIIGEIAAIKEVLGFELSSSKDILKDSVDIDLLQGDVFELVRAHQKKETIELVMDMLKHIS